MQIVVVGTGYVGLVTGACFAEMGNHVTCVDVDQRKIDMLENGEIPIYEPGLDEVVERNFKAGRLKFVNALAKAPKAESYFIAVGTPPGEDGSADLQYVLAVADQLGQVITDYAVIVDKSTVPVGTADKVEAAVQAALDKRGADIPFDVVSNPEFLKEGAAINDFMKPDRVVIGSNSERASEVMQRLYAPFCRNHDRIVMMGVRDAELTKYAANAMLATRISFMNEISLLCDELGADIENIRVGIGSDPRIGYSFLYAGAGYGGSCFPKDVKALVQIAAEVDVDAVILKSVEERNARQKLRVFDLIKDNFDGDLKGKTFAMWGLAFKPGTDDMREAPSKVLIKALLEAGAKVVAFDPISMDVARAEIPADYFESGNLTFVDNEYDTLPGADAMILITEWKQFRKPDFERIRAELLTPVIIDGRNQYDPAEMRERGFIYKGIGR